MPGRSPFISCLVRFAGVAARSAIGIFDEATEAGAGFDDGSLNKDEKSKSCLLVCQNLVAGKDKQKRHNVFAP